MRFGGTGQIETGRESIVPMINVVFLLLIFLLMTAEIEPPAPVEVALPEAEQPPAAPPETVLFIGADGVPALGDLLGDAALAALVPGAPVTLRADAALPAAELARLLPRLAGAGVGAIEIATVTP